MQGTLEYTGRQLPLRLLAGQALEALYKYRSGGVDGPESPHCLREVIRLLQHNERFSHPSYRMVAKAAQDVCSRFGYQALDMVLNQIQVDLEDLIDHGSYDLRGICVAEQFLLKLQDLARDRDRSVRH